MKVFRYQQLQKNCPTGTMCAHLTSFIIQIKESWTESVVAEVEGEILNHSWTFGERMGKLGEECSFSGGDNTKETAQGRTKFTVNQQQSYIILTPNSTHTQPPISKIQPPVPFEDIFLIANATILPASNITLTLKVTKIINSRFKVRPSRFSVNKLLAVVDWTINCVEKVFLLR